MINNKNIKRYCCEDVSKIENYEKAVNSQELWDCHHRMETHRRNGKERVTRLSKQDLKDWELYYDRPASELMFIEHKAHTRLHHKGTTQVYTVERCKHISDALKGKRPSEEARRNMSNAARGNTNAKAYMTLLGKAWKEYKANGGKLTWSEFRGEYKENK